MRRWCEIYFDGRFHQRRSGTGVARLIRIDPGGQQSGNSRRHLPLAPDLQIQVKFRNIFLKEKLYIRVLEESWVVLRRRRAQIDAGAYTCCIKTIKVQTRHRVQLVIYLQPVSCLEEIENAPNCRLSGSSTIPTRGNRCSFRPGCY